MSNPLINGVNYSWANVKLVLFGVPVVGITNIEYKRTQKKENNYYHASVYASKQDEPLLSKWNTGIAA